MPKLLSVEELVINDSFNNYCFQNNNEDVLYWETYINTHPLEKEKVEEARQIVLGLHIMLKQQHDNVETAPGELNEITPSLNKTSVKKILGYISVAAAVLIAIIVIFNPGKTDRTKQNLQEYADTKSTNNVSVFTTANGEKRIIVLPDSTTLHLNAGSTLRIEKGFGKDNRIVYLSGEALFDVTHNKSLPFIVHFNNCDVKVLGTLFNVKAYPDDKTSETSLLRGKVEISMKNNTQKITLSPNQKIIVSNNGNEPVVDKNNHNDMQPGKGLSLLPLSYSEDSVVIETAWAQNRLEIVNESFAGMKEKLERWYNVTIIFKDEDVAKYTFTATFEKETIEQALQALQYAYHFNYTKNGNEITIFK